MSDSLKPLTHPWFQPDPPPWDRLLSLPYEGRPAIARVRFVAKKRRAILKTLATDDERFLELLEWWVTHALRREAFAKGDRVGRESVKRVRDALRAVSNLETQFNRLEGIEFHGFETAWSLLPELPGLRPFNPTSSEHPPVVYLHLLRVALVELERQLADLVPKAGRPKDQLSRELVRGCHVVYVAATGTRPTTRRRNGKRVGPLFDLFPNVLPTGIDLPTPGRIIDEVQAAYRRCESTKSESE